MGSTKKLSLYLSSLPPSACVAGAKQTQSAPKPLPEPPLPESGSMSNVSSNDALLSGATTTRIVRSVSLPTIVGKKNPWAKIADSARSLVRMTVHGTLKGGPKFKALVGTDGMQFRLHLQSLWLPGMSWLNFGRGGWTIGHIKPVLSFKESLHTSEGLSTCFHFSNLQPEWEEVNNFKHSNTSLSPVQLVVTNQIRKSLSEREKEPTKRRGHPGPAPKPPLPLFVADTPTGI